MRKLKIDELNRISVDEFKAASKTELIIIMDNVRSLNNVGSVFRTSDAFRIAEIVLCGITATPPHNEIHKTALGAEEAVIWSYYEDTLDAVDYVKREGFKVYAVEQVEGSIRLDEFKPSAREKYAVILGNEVKGVQQKVVDVSDGCLEIPQFGTKHSLNVSITAGIVIWHFYMSIKQ
ncbi:RNA methyltransferase [Saccharicrinis sp. FJH54]|uniref:RNA methyltransferase n=1 Tax=Saccharicrinis sp. FJH54 TaxID=3344665 RepID=UPI0035D4ACA1